MNYSSYILVECFSLAVCDVQRPSDYRLRTWLVAGSGGQGRHGSCRLLPGSPQAVESDSRTSERWASRQLSPGTS